MTARKQKEDSKWPGKDISIKDTPQWPTSFNQVPLSTVESLNPSMD
jgi:hypothetical protein